MTPTDQTKPSVEEEVHCEFCNGEVPSDICEMASDLSTYGYPALEGVPFEGDDFDEDQYNRYLTFFKQGRDRISLAQSTIDEAIELAELILSDCMIEHGQKLGCGWAFEEQARSFLARFEVGK